MKNILIYGASSAVAQSVGRIYAKEGCTFFLAGRDPRKLESVAGDLKVYGAKDVYVKAGDFTSDGFNREVAIAAKERFPHIDIVLVAHGELGDQFEAFRDFKTTCRILDSNFLSHVSILEHIVPPMKLQGAGSIVTISSVAGDRGRKKNFIYGSAKAGLTAFLSGLRQELFHSNVHVMTVKPGFIDSPMTAHMAKGPLWVKPEVVARDIVRGIEKKRDVIYTPKFWRLIMFIIKSIPEKIFKKLSI